MPLKLFARKPREVELPIERGSAVVATRPSVEYEPAEIVSPSGNPLRQAAQLERFGHIMTRPHFWREFPEAVEVLGEVRQELDDRFALVPEGFASLPQSMNDTPGCPESVVDTEPFLLARQTITNAQFQKFVDSGGYTDLSLWPKDIWPHLIDFRDMTGESGPRYWRNGRHDRPLSEHPVVGLCYYEAAAYAQWAGYRLPTEAEWQMAASWRIRSSANVMRRYSWGDAFDIRKCNLWSSNIGRTSPSAAYEAGAAPNGVVQLIGNVWEWTESDFQMNDDAGNPIVGEMILKSIRGGAFDTYFSAQATSTFRTGAAALARTHNIGFRCAMDLEAK